MGSEKGANQILRAVMNLTMENLKVCQASNTISRNSGESRMTEDKELEEIRRRKLEELAKKNLKSDTVKAGVPMEVTDENFNEVIKKGSLVVIDCWAPWCAPCRMVAPVLEELAKEYAGKIIFGKLNVDMNQKVPMEHIIMSIPTLLVFKDGQLVDRLVGAMPKKILESKITKYL